jgi:hypothetical protein
MPNISTCIAEEIMLFGADYLHGAPFFLKS